MTLSYPAILAGFLAGCRFWPKTSFFPRMSNTAVALAETTMTMGYFNPNPYRVKVAISELNISVELGPMEFILDRANHKINDPLLERYVGARMLSPEISPVPVPLRRIPVIAPARPISTTHVVHQGVKDPSGKWVPAVPSPTNPVVAVEATPQNQLPPPSTTSIQAMSIEEATRRGFIGRKRLVSEEYGLPETDSPSSASNIPEIKYAVESFAPKAKAGNLPAELIKEVQPGAVPLIQSLQQAAAQNPDKVNLSRTAAERAVQEQQGPDGVKQFRQNVKAIKKATPVPAQPAQAPRPSVPRRRVAQVVAPPVSAQAQSALAAVPPPPKPPEPETEPEGESPLVGGRPDMPAPQVEESTAAPVTTAAPVLPATGEQAGHFTCPLCPGKSFTYRSYYIRHLKRKHPDREAELTPPA